MKLSPWVRHLLHRKCRWCHAAGYQQAAAQASILQAQRDALWRQGIDPDKLAEFIRERAA